MDIKSESMGFGVSQVSFRSGPETKITFCLNINIATNSSWESFVRPGYSKKSEGGWTQEKRKFLGCSETALHSAIKRIAEEACEVARTIFRRKTIDSTTSESFSFSYDEVGPATLCATIYVKHRARSQKLIEAFTSSVKTIAQSNESAVRDAMVDVLTDRDAAIRDAEVDARIHSVVDDVLSEERSLAEHAVGASERRAAAIARYRAEMSAIESIIADKISESRSETLGVIFKDRFGDELVNDIGSGGVDRLRAIVLASEVKPAVPNVTIFS